MFILYANKNQLTVEEKEPITSGSVNVYRIQFEFSEDWEGMKRVAVFSAGGGKPKAAPWIKEVKEIEFGKEYWTCEIPWEVLVKPNIQLQVGVYGMKDGETVLPTCWANLGIILEGVTTGEDTRPPTPDLWEQKLDCKGDTLSYTETGELGLYAGDKLLSVIPVQVSGEDVDHRVLTNRDAADQHPIEAISGLEEISNKRLLEIWNGGMTQ